MQSYPHISPIKPQEAVIILYFSFVPTDISAHSSAIALIKLSLISFAFISLNKKITPKLDIRC